MQFLYLPTFYNLRGTNNLLSARGVYNKNRLSLKNLNNQVALRRNAECLSLNVCHDYKSRLAYLFERLLQLSRFGFIESP